MKQRCYNPNYNKAHRYSARGIKVCEEWLNDYSAFETWALTSGYRDNLTLDRINNDGDYCPENCQWLTLGENAKKSLEILHEYNGMSKSLTDWARHFGINYWTLNSRLSIYQWTLERCLTQPIRKRKIPIKKESQI